MTLIEKKKKKPAKINPFEALYTILEKDPLDVYLFYYLGVIEERVRINKWVRLRYFESLDTRDLKKGIKHLSKIKLKGKWVYLIQKEFAKELTSGVDLIIAINHSNSLLTPTGFKIWNRLKIRGVWDNFGNIHFELVMKPSEFREQIKESFLHLRTKTILKKYFRIRFTTFHDERGNSLTISIETQNFYKFPLRIENILMKFHCNHCDTIREFRLNPQSFKGRTEKAHFKIICSCNKTVFHFKLPSNQFYSKGLSKTRKRFIREKIPQHKKEQQHVTHVKKKRRRLKNFGKSLILNIFLFSLIYGTVSLILVFAFEVSYGHSFDFLLEYFIGIEGKFFLIASTISVISFFNVKIVINYLRARKS